MLCLLKNEKGLSSNVFNLSHHVQKDTDIYTTYLSGEHYYYY